VPNISNKPLCRICLAPGHLRAMNLMTPLQSAHKRIGFYMKPVLPI
jgi:hypothetical protein